MRKAHPPYKALIGWLCLIFVTSCFLVPFDVFLRFVQGLSSNIAFRDWFARFWTADWFYVVKGWHMTEYAVLVSFAIVTLRRWNIGGHLGSVGIAFAFAVVFAASDEWHQTFVPGRDGCVRDVFIDAGGALLAALYWLKPLRRKIQPLQSGSHELNFP